MSRTLKPEDQISHYRIVGPLGAGGMGVVYRAHDESLDRDVALKVPPAETLGDVEARARLVREAKTASSLNHPHICTIHQVGEDEGQVFIAMELVDGRSLSELIRPRGLPLESVIRYGAQIADALSHAHAHHVVHRDLKCSNVVVTPDGRAKILDFGLARRMGHPGVDDASLARTLTVADTIVGTPHYLAPEVLSGKEADARSDLWALGVMLQEMTSGAPPFRGETSMVLAGSILHDLPAPLPDRVPAGLKQVIQRCLVKEPSQRYQRADEVRAALDALASQPQISIRRFSRPGEWRPALKLAMTLLGIALVASAGWLVFRPREPEVEPALRRLTSNAAELQLLDAAMSPDGSLLVYADTTGIYLRELRSGETRRIPFPSGLHPGAYTYFSWFLDGSRVVVGSGASPEKPSGVWVLSALGGTMRRIADGQGGIPSPDGSKLLVFGYPNPSDVTAMQIVVTRADGTDPHPLVTETRGYLYTAAWRPDGRIVVFERRHVVRKGELEVTLEAHDIARNTNTVLMRDSTLDDVAWLPDGRLILARRTGGWGNEVTTLWVAKLSSSGTRLLGKPRRLTRVEGIASDLHSTQGGHGLSMIVGEPHNDVYIADFSRDGGQLENIQRVTLVNRINLPEAWSPDGSSLILDSYEDGQSNVVRQTLGQSTPEFLVRGPEITKKDDSEKPAGPSGGMVSGDGAWLIYFQAPATWPVGKRKIYRMPIGGGPSQVILESDQRTDFRCAAAPESLCVMSESEGAAGRRRTFSAFTAVGGLGRVIARVDADSVLDLIWDLSADGRYLAMVMNSDQVVSRVRVISVAAGSWSDFTVADQPRLLTITWARDGKSLLAVAGNRIVRLDLNGRSQEIFRSAYGIAGNLRISPDGRRLAFGRQSQQWNAWVVEGL